MSGADPLQKFVDDRKKKVPGRKIIEPPGGKGEDFLSSEWLETGGEPTKKQSQEVRNRSTVFTSDEGETQKTRGAAGPPPGGHSHGIFGGEERETVRTSTKVICRPGGETHNIFGVDEDDEDDKKRGKKIPTSPPSHNIFSGAEETTSKPTRPSPSGNSFLTFGSSNTEVATKTSDSGIFGGSKPNTPRNSSRVLKPPGGGSSGIFG